MRVLLVTSIKFPSPLANRIQVTEMAREFARALGGQFFFGGRNLPPELDVPVELIRIEGKKRSIFFAWRYLKAIKEFNITHVYCREKRLLFFILLYRPLFLRARMVHFFYEEHAEPETRKWWYRFILKHVDGVITLNTVIKERLKKYILEKRIIVLPHGVSFERFDISVSKQKAREKLALPQDTFIAGYLGTFQTMGSVKKGMDSMFDVVKSFKSSSSKFTFMAVGGTTEENKYYKLLVEHLEVGEQCWFFDRVSRDGVALYQKACDVLLLPLPPNEYTYMLPLKVFEYMASKRPIIVSDLPSVRDVLNERNALLVPPASTSALRDAIQKLMDNPDIGASLAEQAYKDVKQFSWRGRVEAIISFMQDL